MLSPRDVHTAGTRRGKRRKEAEAHGQSPRTGGSILPSPAPSGSWWAGRGWAAPTCMMQGCPPTAVHDIHHAGRLGREVCGSSRLSRNWDLPLGLCRIFGPLPNPLFPPPCLLRGARVLMELPRGSLGFHENGDKEGHHWELRSSGGLGGWTRAPRVAAAQELPRVWGEAGAQEIPGLGSILGV